MWVEVWKKVMILIILFSVSVRLKKLFGSMEEVMLVDQVIKIGYPNARL